MEHAVYAATELDKADVDIRIKNLTQAIVEMFETTKATNLELHTVLLYVHDIFARTPLSPLTSDLDEWVQTEQGVWQNTRRETTFSRDHGQTWYDIVNPSLSNGDTHLQETWAPLVLGDENLKGGCIVRVREDAYGEGYGAQYNGQRGTFASARNGFVYVNYDGQRTNPAPHKPEALERLV